MSVLHQSKRKIKIRVRMSLVSASEVVGGVKEYMYRGLQQLPLVLALTSFIFTITTASIAHSTLFFGLSVVMPIYTALSQTLLGIILKTAMSDQESRWTRSVSDTCNIIPKHANMSKLSFYTGPSSPGKVVPSYWITSVGFFFGYVLYNAIETLNMPAATGADPIAHEKRNTQAVFLLSSICVFFFLILVARFVFMRDCEGRGGLGRALSIVFGISAVGIGMLFYRISKVCGARSSDLFGVLSQILPVSATANTPIVCSEDLNSQ
jgi:hypothetical protein